MGLDKARITAVTEVQANLSPKPAYTIDEFAFAMGRSKKTAYRYLSDLKKNGFVVAAHNGVFALRDSVFLPTSIMSQIIPSLLSLKAARKFRLRNGKLGINKAKMLLEKIGGLPTLDFAAYEITRYQTPEVFYFYPESFEEAVGVLRTNRYVQSEKGRVVLLPRMGDFSNPMRRLFYDCLAAGGRALLDAVAIARLYPEDTKSFSYLDVLVSRVTKIEHDLRGASYAKSSR